MNKPAINISSVFVKEIKTIIANALRSQLNWKQYQSSQICYLQHKEKVVLPGGICFPVKCKFINLLLIGFVEYI